MLDVAQGVMCETRRLRIVVDHHQPRYAIIYGTS